MTGEQRILITGAKGLAGTWLKQVFQDTAVFTTDIAPEQRAHYSHGSLTDTAFVRTLIEKIRPTQVVHCAGVMGNLTLEVLREVNVQGTELLLQALLDAGCGQARVVIPSSSAVYGDQGRSTVEETMVGTPLNNYGLSKVEQEAVARKYYVEYGMPVVIARTFNNSAPGEREQMFISTVARQIARIEKGLQQTLRIGPLDTYRDYLDTRDVVTAYRVLLDKGIPGEVYNICSGVAVAIQDIFTKLCALSTVPVTVEHINADLKPNMVYQCGDNAKLRHLGWQPTYAFERTLKDILDHWRERVC